MLCKAHKRCNTCSSPEAYYSSIIFFPIRKLFVNVKCKTCWFNPSYFITLFGIEKLCCESSRKWFSNPTNYKLDVFLVLWMRCNGISSSNNLTLTRNIESDCDELTSSIVWNFTVIRNKTENCQIFFEYLDISDSCLVFYDHVSTCFLMVKYFMSNHVEFLFFQLNIINQSQNLKVN